MTAPTAQEIHERHMTLVHDLTHSIISQTAVALAARDQADIISGPALIHVGIQSGLSIGIEIGIRAAILDPAGAERIRDAFTEAFRDDDGTLGGAIARAQHYLDDVLDG